MSEGGREGGMEGGIGGEKEKRAKYDSVNKRYDVPQ